MPKAINKMLKIPQNNIHIMGPDINMRVQVCVHECTHTKQWWRWQQQLLLLSPPLSPSSEVNCEWNQYYQILLLCRLNMRKDVEYVYNTAEKTSWKPGKQIEDKINTLRMGAFKLFKCTYPGFKQCNSTFILCCFKNL